MNKQILGIVIIVTVFYLLCVLFCNVEHNRMQEQIGIKHNGWNPCASCWALNIGEF